MVGDLAALAGRDRLQAVLADQLVQQLGVVHDGVVAAELRVLVLEGVEAVRTGHDDLALLRRDALEDLAQLLDVLLGQHLEEELVARAAGGVAGAALGLGQDCELHAGGVEHLRDGLGGLLGVVVVRAGATDPEEVLGVVEVLDVLTEDRHDDAVLADLVDPLGAGGGVLAPGVALGFQVLEQAGQLGREVGLDEHLVTAHVDDVVDVLDVDRALLDAGAAVGAGPQDVRVDDAGVALADEREAQQLGARGAFLDAGHARVAVTGEQVGGGGVGVVAELVDQQLRGQRLGGVPCRALLLAAAALGAGAEVQEGLPGVVGDDAGTHGVDLGVGLLQVHDLAAGGHGLDLAEGVGAVGVALEQDVREGEEAVPGDAPGEVAADDEEPDHAGHQLDERHDGHELGGLGQDAGDAAGDEVGPVPHVLVVRVAVGGELGRLDQDHAEALEEDDGLDEVGGLGVGAVETAETLLSGVGLADDDERQDAQGGADAEDFVDEVPGGQILQDGPAAGGPEGLDVGLEPDQGAEQEADHDEPVGDGDAGLLGHLGVADDLLDGGPDAGAPFAGVAVGLLAGHDRADHVGEALDEDEPAGNGQQETDPTHRQGEPVGGVGRRVGGQVEHAHDVPIVVGVNSGYVSEYDNRVSCRALAWLCADT